MSYDDFDPSVLLSLSALNDVQPAVDDIDCWVQDRTGKLETCFLAVIKTNRYYVPKQTYYEHLMLEKSDEKIHDVYNPVVYKCVFGTDVHHVLAKSIFEMEEGYIFKVPLKCNGNDLRLMYDGGRTRDNISMLSELTYSFLDTAKKNIVYPFNKRLSSVLDIDIVEKSRTSNNIIEYIFQKTQKYIDI